MKKVVIILGALAALLVAGLTAVAFYILEKSETEKNRARTAAATQARWKGKIEDPGEDPETKTESENESTKPQG